MKNKNNVTKGSLTIFNRFYPLNFPEVTRVAVNILNGFIFIKHGNHSKQNTFHPDLKTNNACILKIIKTFLDTLKTKIDL